MLLQCLPLLCTPITITLTINLIRKNNIQKYISRLNTIIVKEITLRHKYRCMQLPNNIVIHMSHLSYT